MSEQKEPGSFRGNTERFTPHDHLDNSMFTLVSEGAFINMDTAKTASLEKSDNITMLLRFSEDSHKKIKNKTSRSKDNFV